MRTLKPSLLSLLAGFLFLGTVTLSCDKDDEDNPVKTTYTLSGTANGAQEVPAVTTNGTGTIAGNYNKDTKLLNYTVTWTGLSGPATNMHFHGPALAGEPAGVALPITGFSTTESGSFTGSATLTAAQETDLLAGKWYYNVHTDANKGGEIRGQVNVQ